MQSTAPRPRKLCLGPARHELQRDTVDAVALAGRLRPIVENVAEMPAAVDTLLPAGSDTLDYQLTAYLDTSVGNPYMYQQLVADFYWWVADSEELAPPTGDTMQPLLWGAVVRVSGAALTVLLRRRREVSHD